VVRALSLHLRRRQTPQLGIQELYQLPYSEFIAFSELRHQLADRDRRRSHVQ